MSPVAVMSALSPVLFKDLVVLIKPLADGVSVDGLGGFAPLFELFVVVLSLLSLFDC